MALMPKAPSYSPVHKLTYVYEPNPKKTEFGGSEFGGYPSLKERADAFDIREEMHVHCGYDLCIYHLALPPRLVAYTC